MIREVGRHGRGALVPLAGRAGWGELAEAVVRPAEVVGGTDQPHAGREGRLGVGDGPAAPGERCEVGAEGGVEPFDVGRIDDGAGRGRRQDRLDTVQGAPNDPAGDANDVPLGRVLNDLGDLETRLVRPGVDDRAVRCTRAGERSSGRR